MRETCIFTNAANKENISIKKIQLDVDSDTSVRNCVDTILSEKGVNVTNLWLGVPTITAVPRVTITITPKMVFLSFMKVCNRCKLYKCCAITPLIPSVFTIIQRITLDLLTGGFNDKIPSSNP